MWKMILLFSLFSLTLGAGSKCNQILGDNAFYTLGPLSDLMDFSYDLDDNRTIYFRFCQFTEYQCKVNGTVVQAYAILVEGEKCTPLTGSQQYQDYKFTLIDEDEPSDGIQLQIPGGQNGTSVHFILECYYEDELDYELDSVNYNYHDKRYTIYGSSPYGCPVLEMNAILMFFDEHYIIISVLTIIIGIILCFYGRRLFSPTLFILGYLVTFMIAVVLLQEFVFNPSSSAFLIWLMLAITIILGVFVGYLAMKLPRLGIACAGLWLGFIVSLLMQNAFLYKISSSNVPFYIVLAILSVAFAVAGWFYFDIVLIIVTSLFGSYLIFRPLGYYLGDYPSEFHITDMVYYGQVETIPTNFYFFFAAILILALIGSKFQHYQKWQGLAPINLADLSSSKDATIINPDDQLEMGQLPEYVELKEALSRTSRSGSFKQKQAAIVNDDPVVESNNFEQQQHNRISRRSSSPDVNRVSSSSGKSQDEKKPKAPFLHHNKTSSEHQPPNKPDLL